MLLRAGWLWLVVASVTAEIIIYAKLGDEVNLKPDPASVTDKTHSIIWKVGLDIAADWDGTSTQYYRHFKERGYLDNLTGVMRITGLLFSDSEVYTPDINDKQGTPIRLFVVSVVPKPTIDHSCPEGKSECNLTCNGNTTGAEPVTYEWNSDNDVVADFFEKNYIIKEESSEIKEFACKMKNPVSEESSDPFLNPFNTSTNANRKVFTGFIVLFSLLVLVMLPVVFHRIRTGEWFFEKESMPWERDFWRKKPEAEFTGSNGTATPSHRVETEEERPMTES